MLALLSFIGIIEIESFRKPTTLTNTINKLSAEQSLFLDVSSPAAEQKKDPGYESTTERERERERELLEESQILLCLLTK